MAEMQTPDQPGPPPGPLAPHRGVMILIIGILGLVLGPTCCVGIVFGILAWVFGSQDLREMAAGRMDPSGLQLTQVGRVLGIIGVALTILSVILGAFFGFAGFMQAMRHGGLPR